MLPDLINKYGIREIDMSNLDLDISNSFQAEIVAEMDAYEVSNYELAAKNSDEARRNPISHDTNSRRDQSIRAEILSLNENAPRLLA